MNEMETKLDSSNSQLTAERSLQIISESIEQSRRDIERGSWKPMMVWGLSVTVIALVVGHLWQHTSMGSSANGLWGLLGIVAVACRVTWRGKMRKLTTFVGKNIGYVWGSFGIACGLLGAFYGLLAPLCLHAALSLHVVQLTDLPAIMYFPVTCVIIFSMGVAGMITGMMLRSRAIEICCGVVAVIGSIMAVALAGPLEMVVMAGSSFIGLVVPALIIRMNEKN